MRIALVIEYDGTNYSGWQIQPNGKTVQEVIENAYFTATGEEIKLVASGRTDAGVHAVGQVAHFDTKLSQPEKSFMHILNNVLPEDIKVRDSFEVDENFHARYSAKRKTYAYSAYIDGFDRPLSRLYSARLNKMPDIEKMQSAKNLLIGEHDFKCFSSSNSSVKTTVRTIYDLQISIENNRLTFTVTGNGFLYNMVRIIVGALIEVGYGRLTESEILSALSGGGRNLLGKTMPACGLTLLSVEY